MDIDKREYRELIEFLSSELSVQASQIHIDSVLEENLGVYGDDAIDLILLFSKKFDVNVENFDIYKYFSPEGGKIFFKFRYSKGRKQKELTVKDLLNAIFLKSLE